MGCAVVEFCFTCSHPTAASALQSLSSSSGRGKGHIPVWMTGKVVYKKRLKNMTFSLKKYKLQVFGHFPSPFRKLGSKWLKVS